MASGSPPPPGTAHSPIVAYSDQYAAVAREVHKRAVRPLGAPSLFWHIGLWNTFDRNHPAAYDAYLGEWEAFVENLYARAGVDERRRVSIRRGRRSERVDYAEGGGVVPIDVGFGDGLLKIIVCRQYEHTTVTFLLDLSKKADNPDKVHVLADPEASGDVARVREALRDVERLLDQHHRAASLTDAKAGLIAAQDELYEGFWRRVVNRLGIGAPVCAPSPYCSVFADFRGLVLSVGDESATWKPTGQPLFAEGFDAAASRRAVNRALPFVAAAHPNPRDAELVVCTLNRGRVIYAGAVGAVGPYVARPDNRAPEEERREPLKALYLTNGLDDRNAPDGRRHSFERWQLGRLISRVNDLGVMRLMGLRDVQALHDAGDELVGLGGALDKLFIEATDPGSSKDLRPDLEDFFNRITRLCARGFGGLQYRIEQSRWFFDGYRRSVADLDIGRIEGFQPLDEFVRRRLYGVFDNLDRIGQRVDRLNARANTLLSYIDAKATLQNLRREAATLDSLYALQHAADVLVPIAGGYYLAHVLTESFVGLAADLGEARLFAIWAASALGVHVAQRVGRWVATARASAPIPPAE